MKKIIALILALCLFTAVAAADGLGSPAYTARVKAFDVYSGLNAYSVREDSGYILYGMDGSQLTDKGYSVIYEVSFANGLKVRDSEGNFGALNADLAEVVPVQYGYVELTGSWAAAMVTEAGTAEDYDLKVIGGSETAYEKFASIEIYNLADGTQKATLTRDEYQSIQAMGDCLRIRDRSGNVSYYDASFSAITEEAANTAAGKCAYFEKNGSYGLADWNKTVIYIPAEYSSSGDLLQGNDGSYCVDGYYAAVKDGKVNFYTSAGAAGSAVLPETYDYLTFLGCAAAVVRNDKGVAAVAQADGTVLTVPAELKVDSYSSVYIAGGKAYAVAHVDGEYIYTLLDSTGNVLMSGAKDITVTADGHAVVVRENDFGDLVTEIYALN